MSSFERTFEDKGKSGDHQKYGIGYSRNALVDLAHNVAGVATERIGRDATGADLVRDQDHLAGSRLQSVAEVFDACFKVRVSAAVCASLDEGHRIALVFLHATPPAFVA
jgi:hypothetical protein